MASFNNISAISWQLVLLVEETGDNHRLVTGQWFYPGPPVSSANKTDMTEILLKVVFNTIKQTYKMDIVFISSNPTCSCHDIAVM
jgi:hypothetical protein